MLYGQAICLHFWIRTLRRSLGTTNTGTNEEENQLHAVKKFADHNWCNIRLMKEWQRFLSTLREEHLWIVSIRASKGALYQTPCFCHHDMKDKSRIPFVASDKLYTDVPESLMSRLPLHSLVPVPKCHFRHLPFLKSFSWDEVETDRLLSLHTPTVPAVLNFEKMIDEGMVKWFG